jgi:uncharacterized protein YlxW (UPF0749 family)
MEQNQNPQQPQNTQQPQQAQNQANNLQSQIDDLHSKAQSSSGPEKQGYMAKIEELKQKKDSIMKGVQDVEGFMGKF